MEFETRDSVSIEEYVEMVRLKTSVLLGCACSLGAEMSDASAKQRDALYQCAMNLGVAFQLQDDLLDVYGDPAIFGKAIGGDIMNNKKTFLLITAQQKATGDDKEELNYWLNNPNAFPGEKIAAITALYNRLGADTACRDAINTYNAKALAALEDSDLCAEAAEFFRTFAESIMGRKK